MSESTATLGRKPTSDAILASFHPENPERALAVAGGLLGGLGQTLLDAVMHADLRPLWPVVSANPLLRVVDVGTLHLACVAAGVLGLALWGARRARSA